MMDERRALTAKIDQGGALPAHRLFDGCETSGREARRRL
jgi:hypothetical protein